jgi:hypothetical protein
MLPIFLASLGVPLEAEADAAAEALAEEHGPIGQRSPNGVHAWVLGSRALEKGDRQRASAAAAELSRRAAAGGRLDAQLAGALASRLALASGDTSAAIAGLAALRSGAPLTDLPWAPWETLGAERLLLARLRLARGDSAGAVLAASAFDAAAAPIDLLWLRPSLELRASAAGAEGEPYRHRLAALSRP